MTPTTLAQCQIGINNLRRNEPEYDALVEEAIDPDSGEIVARLYLQYRSPFESFRQEGFAATHQEPGKAEKWQCNFAIDDDDPARVLHEFNTKYAALKIEVSLRCGQIHEKLRDEELRQQAERAADEDASINERIASEMNLDSLAQPFDEIEWA